MLSESGRHACPWLGKPLEALGKHFLRTVRVAAKEFAHRKLKLKLASDTRSVFQASMVVTVDVRRRL